MSAQLTFRQLYQLLDEHVQPGTWWPADTDFEIGVGAILTQNTAWINVEQAIAALKRTDQLSPEGIARVDVDELRGLIRPAGFMNAKATYLKNFATWFLTNHETAHLVETNPLRTNLLEVKGVGPETADDMLLYTYDRPVFIWDTYARRMLATAGYVLPKGYEPTRRAFSSCVRDADFSVHELQRFHGLIVEAGKHATAAGGWDTYWQHLQQAAKPSEG
ncbi:MAG TPA: deoxyribonuclease [Candidatus Yaniella excrementavium]|nr:deoxyribonuclease [Candidatus Yaniella excrementavium]